MSLIKVEITTKAKISDKMMWIIQSDVGSQITSWDPAEMKD